MVAKMMIVQKLAGVPTTVAKQYGDILTMVHYSLAEGYGPNAIGGSQCMLCIKGRALKFG